MPGYDGTGPNGEGPLTGGMRGYCNTSDAPDNTIRRPVPRAGFQRIGRGFGGGGGRGRGNRHWFYATGLPRWARWQQTAPEAGVSEVSEVSLLRQETEIIAKTLDAISKRIEQMLKS